MADIDLDPNSRPAAGADDVSDNVWTSEQVMGDARWYWLREIGEPGAAPWAAELRYEGPVGDSIFCERSTLPIPSAERHHALEEVAKAVRMHVDQLGRGPARRVMLPVVTALARLEEMQ